MSKSAVIYAFRSPGSGAVYIGKHQCCPDGWPRRGTGPLPDGYRGSGVVVANFHRRHGAAVQWRILAAVTGDREAVNAAERRAIRLARVLFGRGCVNRADGGDGLSSAEAKALQTLPGVKAKKRAAQKAIVETPEGVARRARATEASRTPEARARRIASLNRPEVLQQLSASHKARAQTPGRKVQLARASAIRRINATWRRLAAERPELFEWT